MIGRIFPPCARYGRVCLYVAGDLRRAEVILMEGVRGHDYRLMARDFELIASLHPGIEKSVFHGVLTFDESERLSHRQMGSLAREWMEGIGMKNTQMVVVAHNDSRLRHVHVVANRIDYDGNPIHNFPEIIRSREVVERLNEKYGLKPVGTKNLRQINFDALDASDTRKYAIFRSVTEGLRDVSTLEQLAERLRQEGIETRYRLNAEGRRVGISFAYQGEAFRGSEIDRSYSLRGLETMLGQRLELTQWEAEKRIVGKGLEIKEAREALRVQEEERLKEAQRESLADEVTQRPRRRLRMGF